MSDKFLDIADHVSPLVWNLIITAVALVSGFIVKVIFTALLRIYKDREVTDYSFIRSVLFHLNRPLNHFIPLLVLNLMMPLMELSRKFYVPLNKTINILLIISLASLLIRSIRIFEDYVYYKFDLNKSNNLKERKVRTQLQFIRKMLIVIIVMITISVILLSFQNVRRIGEGLLTGVGIGGIIIGFAAQKSLGNFLAGFQIAFTQPIRIDDVLVVEGEWGRVEDITLTYVSMRLWDQRRLILPINYFIEKPFQNWTRISADILGTVFLYMDYSIPVDEVRKELTRILQDDELWDRRVNVLQVTDTKEHTIELRALMSAANSGNAFDLRCNVREKLITFIQENYPQSLPHLRTDLGAGKLPGTSI